MTKNTTDELDEILDYAEIFYNDSKWEEREEITPTYTELKARLEALISNREKLLLDRVEKELDESYRKSGQGSRPQFSKDTETRGESYSRTQGFKSAILVAKRHLATLRKELEQSIKDSK